MPTEPENKRGETARESTEEEMGSIKDCEIERGNALKVFLGEADKRN